jgi:hypothetical protein
LFVVLVNATVNRDRGRVVKLQAPRGSRGKVGLKAHPS